MIVYIFIYDDIVGYNWDIIGILKLYVSIMLVNQRKLGSNTSELGMTFT